MNADIKTQWLAALRSGEYQQTYHRLRDEVGRMCCLGVLCNMSRLGVWRIAEGLVDYRIGSDAANKTLPRAVVEWAGLEDSNPFAGPYSLALWNDGDAAVDVLPHTFAEIANLIEEYL